MANNKTYTIINDADLTQAKVDACLETSLSTVRKNSDNSSVILKWLTAGGTPSELGSVTEYTHDQILTEVDKEEWSRMGDGDSLTSPDGEDKQNFVDANALFVLGDVSGTVEFTDTTNAVNSGTFSVTDFVSSTEIKILNASGTSETSTFGWRLT